ncbi:MAG: glutaredoxin domain-containing protein [Dokdonella sp.]
MMKRAMYGVLLAIGAAVGVGTLMVGGAMAAGTAKASPQVIMYATKTCAYCAKARAYFRSHNVTWEERDIEDSTKIWDEWHDLGGVGTPLILIDGEKLQGFDQTRLDAALARHGAL